ncbi:MAG: pyridoxamine 5'-phosphate oxidase family protein [Bacteroidales bacterium]|nr:pyridoxamine 5'-phosphate oxidase family protein [Bacteroidales bacterium]NLM91526.1 pyridoxamine 5'-phosphate oxidase family protein [Bacteroidales bacterium]
MRTRMTTDSREIKDIIEKCDTCFTAMVDQEGLPYVVPMNFGYEDGIIYLHSGKTGHKLDILKNNPETCIAFSTDHKIYFRHETVACSYGMDYRSVLAFGKVAFIEDYDEKVRALNIIMRKYTGKEFPFNAPAVNNVEIYKLEPVKIEGKVSGS